MIRCPCCNCLTIDDSIYPITTVCEVCYWQYDETCQENPDISIGPNKVSLNDARKNYKAFKASEYRFIEFVRKPYANEI